MFSYYGSKSKVAKLYPPPSHSVIVEPFAGSARYALEHWHHDVRLYDVSPMIVRIWHYLQQASTADILGLPDVPSKQHIDVVAPGLSRAERDLIGLHLCRGKAVPRKTGHGQNGWSQDKVRIAGNLHKIKHWKIEQRDYAEIPNDTATYFIDPPYQHTQERKGNSDRYPFGNINYAALAAFVLTRKGQVIACEGAEATYLPFELLTTVNTNTNNTAVKKSGEYMYYRDGEAIMR